MRKTLVLLGEVYNLELSEKQGDIFERLDDLEYFSTKYSFRREQVLSEIRNDIKNNKVVYKSISMKDVERVIELVNNEIVDVDINDYIKQQKEDFYNAIVDEDDTTFLNVAYWLDDNWDNDNALFVENYPFNYSFDELIFEGIEFIKENTNLEDIRKWAK